MTTTYSGCCGAKVRSKEEKEEGEGDKAALSVEVLYLSRLRPYGANKSDYWAYNHMQEQPTITESFHEGNTVRSHSEYPMFRVTDDGRVLGARGFWLKTKPQKSGHTSVCYFNAEKKQCYIHVHRLVALCYVPNPDPAANIKVDHRDNDPKNNHHTNLRWVTARQNCQNLAANKEGKTSSRYVGVGWHKEDRRWRAQIRMNGKNRGLGSFKVEEDAARAYDAALLAAGLEAVNFPSISE